MSPALIVLSVNMEAAVRTGHHEVARERTVAQAVRGVTLAIVLAGMISGDRAVRRAGGAATIVAPSPAMAASVTAEGPLAAVLIAGRVVTAGTEAVRRGAVARSPAGRKSSLGWISRTRSVLTS
jgi:hypothetical protein